MTLSLPIDELLPAARDCAPCRDRLQEALGNLPDVRTAHVSARRVELDAPESSAPEVRRVAAELDARYGHAAWAVEGMDCASCAKKIEGAAARVPGLVSSTVNFGAQRLTVEYERHRTQPEQIARAVAPLGYPLTPLSSGAGAVPEAAAPAGTAPAPGACEIAGDAGHDHAGHDHAGHDHTGHDHARSDHASPASPAAAPRTERPWYATRQGRIVLGSGALVALAFLIGSVAPRLSYWAYVAATVIAVLPLVKKAYVSARLGDVFSINALVSIASLGALFIGEAAEGALVVFLFAVGELLEGIAAGRARAGIRALAALAPKTALLLENGRTREVPAEHLAVGQLVQVRPGGRVPADGTIVSGSSSLDDSPVTGESIPVLKEPGDAVFAGSINTDGVLTVRVEKTAADNTIARIIHLVEEAESSKAPTARFIDKFSRYYTPGVVAVSALVVVVPPLLFGGAWGEWIYKGLALLLIGCPCALVLSTPAAITSGISSGARRGLLIKGGAALEAIGSVTRIAFDKTGTLTENRPRVTDVIPLAANEGELLALAAAVESGSSHPLAKAIVERAAADGVTVPAAEEARAIQGKAATATVAGRALAVGSPRYAAEATPLAARVRETVEQLERDGKTVVVLVETGGAPDGAMPGPAPRPLGLIAIRDEPRADARQAVAELRALGVSSVMLTGDNARTGSAIGAGLDVEVRAELMPEDKLRLVEEMKQRGTVGMVGDGINDAPALALADVGIAMGGGTDVALETADAALLRNSVTGVAELVELSRATMRNIRQNIAFALGLKAIFLVTTLLGITTLWMAILADTGATAIVTANALRLLGFRARVARREAVHPVPIAPPVPARAA